MQKQFDVSIDSQMLYFEVYELTFFDDPAQRDFDHQVLVEIVPQINTILVGQYKQPSVLHIQLDSDHFALTFWQLELQIVVIQEHSLFGFLMLHFVDHYIGVLLDMFSI